MSAKTLPAPAQAPPISLAGLELALLGDDLSQLTNAQRLQYMQAVCQSLGLNPLTKPFRYIVLKGKLTFYATRDCTEQLRKLHQISLQINDRQVIGDILFVTARATDPSGRFDESIGAVSLAGLRGEDLANAYMKAETKAKRRVTLSFCGLGMLDESETDSIPGAVRVSDEVVERSRPVATTARPALAASSTPAAVGKRHASYGAATGLNGKPEPASEPAKPQTVTELKHAVKALLLQLGQTEEQAAAPKDYVARVLGRDSLARLGDLTAADWDALWLELSTAREKQGQLFAAWRDYTRAKELEVSDRQLRLAVFTDLVGREVTSSGLLTPVEMVVIAERLRADAAAGQEAEVVEGEPVETGDPDPFAAA